MRFLSFPEIVFILMAAVNFSLLSKALITAQHKKFVAKIMRLILQVYFNVKSDICCTNLFFYGGSFTHGNCKNLLFRYSIADLSL